MVTITLPIRIVSPNVQEHWSKRYKRNKKFALLLKSEYRKLAIKPTLPCTVTFTRIAPRQFDSEENLPMAFKSLKDELADLLNPTSERRLCMVTKGARKAPKVLLINMGKADNTSLIKWLYAQKKGLPREYKVQIDIS